MCTPGPGLQGYEDEGYWDEYGAEEWYGMYGSGYNEYWDDYDDGEEWEAEEWYDDEYDDWSDEGDW